MTTFPYDCHALLVEPEPVTAMALDLLLEEFGCRSIGPVDSLAGVTQLLSRMQPSFALIDVDLRDELEPITAYLSRHEVPFALMAVGAEARVLEQVESLRDYPRLLRPLDAGSLHATASALYQEHLRMAIASADRHIARDRLRLLNQLKLIEHLAAAGQDTTAADALAQRSRRLMATMRTTRLLLARRMEIFASESALPPTPQPLTAKPISTQATSMRAARWTS